jgi:hypothetical protein
MEDRTDKQESDMGHYNIPTEIMNRAKELGLYGIGTGGGCDYVYRKAEGCEIIMSDTEDASSPDTLDSPAEVCIFVDDKSGGNEGEWYDGITIKFKTAEEAMVWMAGVEIKGFRA